jgi:orotidine-5'-phosphate decarboxylase
VPCVKPQVAFYEKYGSIGLQAFKDTVDYAHNKGLVVIEDGKRGDIGSTSQAYADGHLGVVQTQSSQTSSLDADLLTVNPYLGSDGLLPFVNVCKEQGKGIFILTKTSNPSAGEFQDRLIDITPAEEAELKQLGITTAEGKTQLYNLVALQVNRFAQGQIGERGYSQIGAVVGATYPHEAETLRKLMPNSIFLVPGYGAQGGTAKDLVNCFNSDGYGAVVSSSRGIIFAYEKGNPKEFAQASREAVKSMIKDICSALEMRVN